MSRSFGDEKSLKSSMGVLQVQQENLQVTGFVWGFNAYINYKLIGQIFKHEIFPHFFTWIQ